MRKSSVLLAAVSLVCALGAAWSWRELRAERAKVAMLEQQLTATRQPPPAVAAPVLPQESPTPASASAVKSTPDPEAAREKEAREQIRAAQNREREMMRDPSYRKSRVDEWRRRYAQTRADAIRVVGLTPEQADQLVELSIERNMSTMELFEYPGQTPSPAAQATLKRLNEQYEAQLRELLGDRYERWNWYQATGGERNEVSMLRAQLSTTGEPLQDREADALVEALYNERQRRDREYDEYASAAGITNRNIVSPQDRQRWIDLEKESNQRIHDSVAGMLSRSQLSTLDEALQANVAPVEAALRMQLEGRMAKAP